nr:phage tail protein [uncultured Rhodopila sp.]
MPTSAGGAGVEMFLSIDGAVLASVTDQLAQIPGGFQRAAARSVNLVTRKVNTRVLRSVSGEINVSQAELRRRNVSVRQADLQTLQGAVNITGRRIPLYRFGARQTRLGVTYGIRRGGSRTTMLHAFIATMPSGHIGVFFRKKGAKTREIGQRSTALPIQEPFGPSVPVVVENAEDLTQEALDQTAGAELEAELLRQADLIAQGKALPAGDGG